MISCLDRMKLGLISPASFHKAEITRRTINMQLSSVAVVEPCFRSSVLSIDLDSTGRYLLSGASDGTWYIHDTFNLTGKIDHQKNCVSESPQYRGHGKALSTVEWYPADSGLFTTSSVDGLLFLWDANNDSKPVDKYDLDEPISRHHINPRTGSTIAACCEDEVHLIDIRAGTAIQTLPTTYTVAKEVRWNPANQHILLVGTEEGNIIEWDIRSTFNYRCYSEQGVKTTRRGVRTRTFQENVGVIPKAHRGLIKSIRYRKNGLEFYTISDDGRIRKWLSDLSPTSETEPLACSMMLGKMSKGHGNYQFDVSAETDPAIVFAPIDSRIAVCDMKECYARNWLTGHFKNANCFVYSSEYQCGYSGGNDNAVMVWSGHVCTEQSYQAERVRGKQAIQESPTVAFNRRRQAMFSLLDMDSLYEDQYEEYEPAFSSSDESQ